MPKTKNSERKPLSFSTTMRNPARIAGFLNCLLPFENKILTSELIHEVVKNIIKNKLYKPVYVDRTPLLKNIYLDEDTTYNNEQIEDIIKNSPQQHKEAGFDYGWDSRFDTWYKLPMEFGFVYYEMNEPLRISNTGHMLIDAYNEFPTNELKIQNVMLNAIMKYQTNNPFRKNLNSNAPLPLLLNVLKLLKEDKNENGAGLFRKEISILACWNDNNAQNLYKYIKNFRKQYGYNYSDELIYEKCLNILGTDLSQSRRFKMSQICGNSIDEYIRKMRIAGIISLRGNGRFIDFNMVEEDKINYIIEKYTNYPTFDNKLEYFNYISEIDNKILEIRQSTKIDLSDIKKRTLYKFAKDYSERTIFEELIKVCSKKRKF